MKMNILIKFTTVLAALLLTIPAESTLSVNRVSDARVFYIIENLSSDISLNLTHTITEKQTQMYNEYQPTWESLDKRPLPQWFDSAKIGIFINWGVHSVPSFGSEWFWYYWKTKMMPSYVTFMKSNYPPGFTYQDFAPQFTAEFYNPYDWADIFSKSGARYVVFSSKHHEGYTLWPSMYSFSWNSVDVGPKKDLLGQLAKAIREKTAMKFGVYHSMFEWYNPLWLNDKNNSFKTEEFVRFKTLPELTELVEFYKPEIIWSDGDWEAPDTYWKSKEFLAWLYNSSPVKDTVVVNDRWGTGTMCKHGGYMTCQDRFNPGTLQPFKWENAMTLDKNTWGYRRNSMLQDYLTIQELIAEVVKTVSCRGNILINVGPTKEGTIDPIMQERLLQLGDWLGINGAAIYETKPWIVAQNDSVTNGVWYTRYSDYETNTIYAMVLEPLLLSESVVHLGSVDSQTVISIRILGYNKVVSWSKSSASIAIQLPDINKIHRKGVARWCVTIAIQILLD